MKRLSTIHRGGYAGLMMILLTAIIVFVWAYYYSPLAPSPNESAETPSRRSQGLEAINQAKEMKVLLESRNSEALDSQQ